jgi:hypothetical protein
MGDGTQSLRWYGVRTYSRGMGFVMTGSWMTGS